MKFIKYFGILTLLVILASCNKELDNNLIPENTELSEDIIISEEVKEYTESTIIDEQFEPLESINFRIMGGYGGPYSVRFDDDIIIHNISHREVEIDGVNYSDYGGRSIYFSAKHVNELIKSFSILEYDENGNLLNIITYNNVFIYNGLDQAAIKEVSSTIYDVEILFVVDGDSLKDISLVKDITNLRCISIEWAEILSDISPLAENKYLEIVNIDKAITKDLSALSELSRLRELTISVDELTNEQTIKNIDILSVLVNLEKLELKNFQLEDLDFIKNIPDLEELSIIRNNANTDYSAIESTSVLSSLTIENYKNENIEVKLSSFKNIEYLSLYNVDISGLPWEIENSIEYLKLSSCGNTNFTVEMKLDNLKSLYLEGSEITGLENMNCIQMIQLKINDVHTDYSSLYNFPQLKELSIIGMWNNCETVAFLSEMTDLVSFEIHTTSGYDMTAIESLMNLKQLGIYSPYSSIDLSGLINLEELTIVNVNINDDSDYLDFSSISELEKIKKLSLESVRQNDYGFLGKLYSLKSLYFDFCNIRQLPNLGELNNLQAVTIIESDGSIDLQNLNTAENIKALDLFCVEILNPEDINVIDSLEFLLIADSNIEVEKIANSDNLKLVYVSSSPY